MTRVDFVGVTVVVANDDPIGRAFVDQFDWLTHTDAGSADLTVRFQPGFVSPPDDSIKVHGGIWIGDEIFVDSRSNTSGPFGFIRRRTGQYGYQARISGNPLREPLDVEVYYDEKLTGVNDRALRHLRRASNRDFAHPHESFARQMVGRLFEPLLHQRLLAGEGGLIHASGVARDGAAVLFAGSGAVGKTAISAELIRNHGYDFVSDDLAVVSARGTVEPYPMRVSVYPKSITGGETTYRELTAGRSLEDRLHWRLRERFGGPKGVRRWVPPSALYDLPDQSDSLETPVRTVVNLVTEERPNIRIESTTTADVADRAASTIARELDTFADPMLEIHAAAPARWPSLRTVLQQSADVYERALADAEAFLVFVPPGTTPSELTEVLADNVFQTKNGTPLHA